MSEIWGFKRVEPVVSPRAPRFYEEVYPVPVAMDSHEEWLRLENLDLDEMSIPRAQLELDRSAYYAPTNLMVYGRYRFDPVLSPLENRPRPVQPYSSF